MVCMISDLPPEPPSDAPEALKALWPLVLRWGESDDDVRGHLTAAASEEELEELVDVVAPLYPAINAYLDETSDAERAVPYGDLAQAAEEVQIAIARRRI